MTIYALFICMAISGDCRPVEPPRYVSMAATVMPGRVYSTWGDCIVAGTAYSNKAPDKDGRMSAGNGIWYECRGKHVDTWEPVN